MPSTVLNTLLALSHSMHQTILGGGYYLYPKFLGRDGVQRCIEYRDLSKPLNGREGVQTRAV